MPATITKSSIGSRASRITLGLLTLCPNLLLAEPQQAVNVTLAPLSQHLFYPEYSAPATTLSLNQSQIGAETDGILRALPVLVGQQVTKGDALAELDCQDNRLRLDQARAALLSIDARVNLARQQIKRLQSLRKSSNVSAERLDQQEADLNIAGAERRAQLAAIEEAELNVSRCQIIAPFTGVVTERLAAEGQWIAKGQPILHLTDNRRLEVSAQISSDIAAGVKQAEQIQLESSQGHYPVKLRKLVPIVSSRGRNQEARFVFTNSQALPGTTGRLVWKTSQPHIAADLPVSRDQQMGVFLVESGKARFHPLPAALEGRPAIIDLPADTMIVIEGRHALSNGSTVEVNH